MNSGAVKKIFDELTWPEFEKKIEEKLQTFFNENITDENMGNVSKNAQEFIDAKQNYKKNFKWAKYYTLACLLPFAVITIVFAYIAIKSFRAMNKEKKALLAEYNKQNQERIDSIKQAVGTINFYKIFDICMNDIGYNPRGPIPTGFIKKLNEHVVFETDLLKDTPEQNSFISSWGSFHDHIVVLNMANKKHWIGKKTYSKSVSFPYTIRTQNGYTTSYETLTAYYDHPFPEYSRNFNVGIFTSTCEGLKLSLKEDSKNIFTSKKDKRPSFDNPEFEKIFEVERNDEAMARLVFTADVQEYLVQMKKNMGKKQKFPKYLRYNKAGPIFSSSYIVNNPINFKNNFNWNSLKETNITIDDFLKSCTKVISGLIKDRFLGLNVATSLPILATEDKSYLIKELNNLYLSKTISHEDKVYAQYVFNTIWEREFLKSDTDVMNTMEITGKGTIGNSLVTTVKLTAYGYLGEKMTKAVPVSGVSGFHTILVPYIDYKQNSNFNYMFYARIDNLGFYEEGQTDFDKQIVNAIQSLNLQSVKIKNKHIVYVTNNQNEYSNFSQLVSYIAQIPKK
ncbi:MAG: DUF3137 domain-containing protein [Mycoplasma sp.]